MALDGGNHAGWTPLMYASYHGHPALVAELLSRHADPSRANNKGRCRCCFSVSVLLFLSSLLSTSFIVRTPLILSAMCGNRATVSTLLSASTQPKSQLISAADQVTTGDSAFLLPWG